MATSDSDHFYDGASPATAPGAVWLLAALALTVLGALPLAGLGAPGLPGRLLQLAAQPGPNPFVEWTLTGRYADPDAARPSLSRRAFDEAAQ